MPPEVDHTHSPSSDFPQQSDGTQFARNGNLARGCVPRDGSSECDRILRTHIAPSPDAPTLAKTLLSLKRCFRDLVFPARRSGQDRARIGACNARSVKFSTAGRGFPTVVTHKQFDVFQVVGDEPIGVLRLCEPGTLEFGGMTFGVLLLRLGLRTVNAPARRIHPGYPSFD